ncbi:MAG: hypothetical protein F6J94_25880, partial [Moorea sp. SIO1F2]
YNQEELIKSTEDSVQWNVKEQDSEVVIELETVPVGEVDVRVTINTNMTSSGLLYRQSVSGQFVPIKTGPNDMLVSTSTQFKLASRIYKYTKGSWTQGGQYLANISSSSLKFETDTGSKATPVLYHES